jgi:hypothetical protein
MGRYIQKMLSILGAHCEPLFPDCTQKGDEEHFLTNKKNYFLRIISNICVVAGGGHQQEEHHGAQHLQCLPQDEHGEFF